MLIGTCRYSLSDAPNPEYFRISVKRESGVRAVTPSGAVDTGAEAAGRGDQHVKRGMVSGHIGADVSDCLHPF